MSLPHLCNRKLLFFELFISQNIEKTRLFISKLTNTQYRNNFDVAILTVHFDASRSHTEIMDAFNWKQTIELFQGTVSKITFFAKHTSTCINILFSLFCLFYNN